MNKALESINLYLSGKIDLPSLEGLIVSLAWNDEFEDQDLIDLVSIEIAYVNDGVTDEVTFKTRISQIATPRISAVI